MPEVLIKGGGVAACCCARLLSRAGHRIFVEAPKRGGSPTLMLSDQTQKLLTDVFGNQVLFEGSVGITKRVVKWGPQSEPLELPHSGLVMRESVLLERLWSTVETECGQPTHPVAWSIIASNQEMPEVTRHEFGSRTAFTSTVDLTHAASREACWVESTPGGWLFLLPSGSGKGSLISVGGVTEVLLGESTLVAGQIAGTAVPVGSFPAFPRIVKPLAGAGWIACGSAAVAFDPIAGEGAGNAIREGILAAAVIQGLIERPGSEELLLGHYAGRIFSGFLRHLEECCRFYDTGGSGSWWQGEFQELVRGVKWAREAVSSNPANRFRLAGFELQEIN